MSPERLEGGSKSRPVLLYVGVMFAVAMLLLLLSFLMQQRNHEDIMQSVGSVQKIVDLELEIDNLNDQLGEQGAAMEQTEMELEYALHAQSQLEQQRVALCYLLEISHLYDTGKKEDAKALLSAFSESEYRVHLSYDTYLDGQKSPAAIYEELKEALQP